MSRTFCIVCWSPCSVIVCSSTSTGVFVYSTRLDPRSAHRLIWLRGYFRSVLDPSGLHITSPSRPISHLQAQLSCEAHLQLFASS